MSVRLIVLVLLLVAANLRTITYGIYEIRIRNIAGGIAVLLLTLFAIFCGIKMIFGF